MAEGRGQEEGQRKNCAEPLVGGREPMAGRNPETRLEEVRVLGLYLVSSQDTKTSPKRV